MDLRRVAEEDVRLRRGRFSRGPLAQVPVSPAKHCLARLLLYPSASQSRGTNGGTLLMKNNSITTTSSGQPMSLADVLVAFLALVTGENSNHHHMGQLYNYVLDNMLAEAAGYKSALDFFTAQVKDLSRATLVSYGAVARSFTEGVATQFGVTRPQPAAHLLRGCWAPARQVRPGSHAH